MAKYYMDIVDADTVTIDGKKAPAALLGELILNYEGRIKNYKKTGVVLCILLGGACGVVAALKVKNKKLKQEKNIVVNVPKDEKEETED